MIRTFCIITFAFIALQATAQDSLFFQTEEPADTLPVIRVMAWYSGDSAVVRWAPARAEDWMNLNKDGYLLRRIQLNKEGIPVEGSETDITIKPWAPEVFEARMETAGDFVLAAAQCVYGAWESTNTGSLNMHGRYEELHNRHGIALLSADVDITAADALGLRYTDRNAEAGQFYLYQVFAADTSLHVIAGYTTLLTTARKIATPRIDHLVEDEGYVNVKWLRDEHESEFSAYWIEAATPNGSFIRLNAVPFVGGASETYPSAYFSYKHVVDNYTPHRYRIVGITPFGEKSIPSEARTGQARDRTPPATPINLRVSCDEISSTVTINWDPVTDSDMDGYSVQRSSRYDGVYAPGHGTLLQPGTTTYQEEVPDTRMIWYYKVVALDTAGNGNASRIIQAAFRDTLSPETPTGLSGSIDSNGVVRLKWDLGGERDLMGYYVYMANQKDHFFTNMTPKPLSDTTWMDTITLKTFTEQIYYRVSAVDFHSHLSEWTEPLELLKPDTLRPFPPSFSGYRVEKDHIILDCLPSRSKDVQAHMLRRRKTTGENWVPVQGFQVNHSPYLDYEVEPGETYEYELTAVDDAGLSPQKPAFLRVKFVDQRRPEPPVISIHTQEENELELLIEFPDARTTNLIVYRSANDGPLTTIATIEPTQSYTTPIPSGNNRYAWAVKAIRDDGQKSDFSNHIQIDLTQ